MMHRETKEVRPVPCGTLGCPSCTGYLAHRRGLAIAHARPERRFDLTQVGDDWDTIRARMKRLRYDIADAGYAVEVCWSVEPNPEGTGNHVHGFQRGDYIPQAELSTMAVRRGMGEVVWIERMHSRAGSGYGLKAYSYGFKGYGHRESVEMLLELNGGRLTHQSRGFFSGPVREVEQAAVATKRGGESPWLVGTVDELHRAFHREPTT